MATALPTRDEIDQAYLWNLDSYYISDDLWEADYHTVERQLPALAAYERRLTESGEVLLAALTLHDTINTILEKLHAYAFFRRDEDTTNSAHQLRYDRATALEARFHTATAFFRPELLAVDDQALDAWFETTPTLNSIATMC